MKRSVILVCMVMLISAVAAAYAAEPPIVAKCKADLAKQLNLKPADVIEVVEVTPITWPDASLGMPEIGKVYTQALTPGHRIVLRHRGNDYLYTASEKTCRYGGPKTSWSGSVLYLKPKPNDANMNGDLFQSSVMGTNSRLIASEVSDYYPQEKGAVLFTRRTSRSGFDLLYVKANRKSEPVRLHSGLAFGDAAVDAKGKQWAALVRPGLGSGWTVAYGGLVSKGTTAVSTLPLPDGVTPEQIAWSDANLMILAKKGDKTAAYEISPKAEKPEWKVAAYHLFPKVPDLMLNKSESILIDQVEEDGKPAVEIGTVWFTGDRTVNARIEGFTMSGFQIGMPGPYIFVWGQKGGKTAAYTVDFVRGDIIPLPQTVGSNFKPFNFPVLNNPLFREK